MLKFSRFAGLASCIVAACIPQTSQQIVLVRHIKRGETMHYAAHKNPKLNLEITCIKVCHHINVAFLHFQKCMYNDSKSPKHACLQTYSGSTTCNQMPIHSRISAIQNVYHISQRSSSLPRLRNSLLKNVNSTEPMHILRV